MPSELVSRRSILALVPAAAVLPVFAALAASPAEAERLIEKVVAEVQAIINSGKGEGAMLRDFERIFESYADVPIIARSALGAPWKAASERQRQQFVPAFRGYISRKYGKQFRTFIGGRIEIVRSRDAGDKGILVETQALLQGQAPFAVEWQVSDRSGHLKFVNLNIEGIWLLTTEREEIGALLDRRGGDLDRLIADLQGLG
jgi:phospholipid transport system substrate-binding protein